MNQSDDTIHPLRFQPVYLSPDCFKNVEIKSGSAIVFGRSRNDAENFILKHCGKDDGFGIVSVQWKQPNKLKAKGGHAFLWEIKDGIVSFSDSDRDDNSINIYWDCINTNDFFSLCRMNNIKREDIIDTNLKKYGVKINE